MALLNITEHEREAVLTHYATRGPQYIAEMLGVPSHRIRRVAGALGVQMDKEARRELVRMARFDAESVTGRMKRIGFELASRPQGLSSEELCKQGFQRETAAKFVFRMNVEGKLIKRVSGSSGVLDYRFFVEKSHADAFSLCSTREEAQVAFAKEFAKRERDRNNKSRRKMYKENAEFRAKQRAKSAKSNAKRSKIERSASTNRPWVGQKVVPSKKPAWSGEVDYSRAKITIAPTPKPRFDPTDTAERVFSAMRPGQYLVGSP